MNQRRLSGTVRTVGLIRTLALLPLLATSIGPAAASAETVHTPVLVSAVARGIRLTLVVPRDRYPVDALARVSVIMTNVSHRSITIRTVPRDLGGLVMSVVVQDVHGNNSTLPIEEGFEYPAYSKVTGYDLLPGHTIRVDRYVVITGPRLVAVVDTLPPNRTSEVHSPVAHVTLVPGAPVALTVRGGRGRRFLQFSPPRTPDSGPLRYIQSLQCTRPHGYELHAQNDWVAVPHRSIYPACRPIQEWRVVAGYLNQPVAAIDLVSGTRE